MSKHTPGPWFAAVGTSQGMFVTRGMCWEPKDRPDYCVKPLHVPGPDADAHLIAAAPEMYQALTRLREAIEAHGKTAGYFIAELGEADAALAKAEGRS